MVDVAAVRRCATGRRRTGELARRAGGISQKMLTQTLRELRRHGIVRRHDFGEVPPRVEYSLTPLGDSLAGLVRQIEGWVDSNYPRMTRCRAFIRLERDPAGAADRLGLELRRSLRAHLFGGDARRQLE